MSGGRRRRAPPEGAPHDAPKRAASREPKARSAASAKAAPGAAPAALAMVAGLAALALLVYAGNLAPYFSPDDLRFFERARGVAPFPPTLWRFASQQLYAWLVVPLAGLDPLAHQVVMLTLHVATMWAIAAWAASLGAGRGTAFAAAALWGTSRLGVNVVYQVSVLGDVLAALCALLALRWLARPGRAWPWAAGAVTAFGLLAKENNALLPLVALIGPRGALPERARRLRVAGLAALGVAAWGYVLLFRQAHRIPFTPAYEMGWGPHIVRNLLTYAAWSWDLLAFNRDFAPLAGSDLWLRGGGALLGWAGFAWAMRRWTTIPLAGLALWVAGILPVLGLRYQTHPHYLYTSSIGVFAALAAAVAPALAALFPRPATSAANAGRPAGGATPARGSVAAVAVALLLIAHAAWTRGLIQARASARMPSLDLPYDSMFRKMEYARRFVTDLSRGLPAGAAKVVILSPPESREVLSVRTGRAVAEASAGAPRYDFTLAVLDSGRALPALIPGLDSVRFEERWSPGLRGYTLATPLRSGYVRVLGSGAQAHRALAETWMGAGLFAQARDYLADVRRSEPYDGVAAVIEAAATARAGDVPGARTLLEEAMRRDPGTPAAEMAGKLLAQLAAPEAAAR